MKMKVILYTDTDGNLCVITPALELSDLISINDVAMASVPAGMPYVIVDEDAVPSDRTFRDAWQYDTETNPDGVGPADGTVIAEFESDGIKLVKGEGFVEL